MRRGTFGATALGALVGLVAPRVAAQDVRAWGTLAAGVGVTDNLGFVANRPADAIIDPRCGDGTWSPPSSAGAATPTCYPARRVGPLFTVSPGVVVALETPRARYQAGYTLSAQTSPVLSSYSNRLQLGGAFAVTPTSELALGAHVSQGSTNALALTADASGAQPGGGPAAAGVAALPSASLVYVSGGVSQRLRQELSPVVTLTQGLSLTADTPVLRTTYADHPYRRSWGLAATGGIERAWQRDAIGLTARVELATQTQLDAVPRSADPADPPARVDATTRHALFESLVATYRRDLGHFFSGELGAGVLAVSNLASGAVLAQPTGTAAIRYARLEGSAELAFAHTALPNPLLGVNLVTETVTLRGAVPLDRRGRWVAASSSGFAHTRQILDDGSLATPMNLLRGDVTLGFAPIPTLLLSLRYQHHRQLPTEATAAEESAGAVQTGEVAVSTLLFQAAITFPPQDGPPIVFRPPLRVDRADGASFLRGAPAPPPAPGGRPAR